MESGSFLVVARRDIPELGITAGDVLRYDPSDPLHSWTHHRRRSFDPGAILVGLNEGALEQIDIMPAGVSLPSRSPSRSASVLPLLPRRPRVTGSPG